MPRTFNLEIPGATEAQIAAVSMAGFSREDLYGEKTGEKRDTDGNVLQNASLSEDGMHIFTNGGMSNLHLDTNGHLVTAYKPVDADGREIPLTPSMFNEPRPIRYITSPQFYMLDVMKTYTLHGDLRSIIPAIKTAAERNEYIAFTYAYFNTPTPLDAVLTIVGDEVIVLLGKIAEPQFFAQQIAVPLDEDEDSEEEELDFNAW